MDQLAFEWDVMVFRWVEASVRHQCCMMADWKTQKKQAERTKGTQCFESVSIVESTENAVSTFQPPWWEGVDL